ncbi:hypothetical protein M422DRAFT_38692 [Sphaerobolus stellatus SS14]|uniref:Uncharacterized protein n=1 Tax=Sphaerobolus stellatus (strain SS14) TaxID=990650 RepID=A0A0C9UJA0_SPHS4|nr:hypothetical protein M422DRAFT_38692 [Sphaerobolus stellatus SS14]
MNSSKYNLFEQEIRVRSLFGGRLIGISLICIFEFGIIPVQLHSALVASIPSSSYELLLIAIQIFCHFLTH